MNELLSQKAYFYVCGDAANMAREVNAVLAQIIAEGRGVTEAKGEDIVKNMRAANQYQVRNISITTLPFESLHTCFLRKTMRQWRKPRVLRSTFLLTSLCRRMSGLD